MQTGNTVTGASVKNCLRKLQRAIGKEGRSANGSLYRKGMNTACRFTKQEVSYTSATRRRRPKPGGADIPPVQAGTVEVCMRDNALSQAFVFTEIVNLCSRHSDVVC